MAEEIEVAGRSVRCWRPQAEEHGAFQNEAIAVW